MKITRPTAEAVSPLIRGESNKSPLACPSSGGRGVDPDLLGDGVCNLCGYFHTKNKDY